MIILAVYTVGNNQNTFAREDEQYCTMVWTAKEAKKKLGVLTEKNLAFLAAVEKLEDILTEKSYAVSLRDARKQETKLTEYITKFSCEDIEFELEEHFTEQCSNFEATI